RGGARGRWGPGARDAAGGPAGPPRRRCPRRRTAPRARRSRGCGRRPTPAQGGKHMSEFDVGMAAEFREAPDIVRRQSKILPAPIAALVARLKRKPPIVVLTCARGSSAHAATFGKHLIERHLGIPCAS